MNLPEILVPTDVTAPMRPAINPYSIAVAPESSLKNFDLMEDSINLPLTERFQPGAMLTSRMI